MIDVVRVMTNVEMHWFKRRDGYWSVRIDWPTGRETIDTDQANFKTAFLMAAACLPEPKPKTKERTT